MAKEKAEKKAEAKGLSFGQRHATLRKWLGEKRLQFEPRQSVEVYDGELAKRLIEIMDEEPDHPVAKALRGK